MAIQTKYNIHDDLIALAVPIDQLDMLPGNPNQGDVEAIARSYKKWGQRKPVVGRRMPGDRWEVSAGNHQLLAARDVLGWTHLALVRTEDNEAEGQAFAIADNHTARMGEDDKAALLAMMESVNNADADLLAAASYSEMDIDLLRASVAPQQDILNPDDIPEAPVEPVSQRGDLWLLGDHRLLCGDSTVHDEVARLMDGGKADLVFTDPPYGVDYTGGVMTPRDALDGDSDTQLYGPCCQMAFAFSAPDAPLYLWHAGVKGISAAAAAAAAGYEIRAEIIWNKNQAQFGALSAQYKQKHEPCFYCYKRGSSARWSGPTNEVTVWDIDRASVNEFHPTQKPVALAVRALGNHRCTVVLDLFGGSGSTLIACYQVNKVARIMEKDRGYVDVICTRYQAVTGVKPVLESTGMARDFGLVAA